ncbi:MAG: hypothetical protein ACHREM_10360 [Polyangiales bacterium]
MVRSTVLRFASVSCAWVMLSSSGCVAPSRDAREDDVASTAEAVAGSGGFGWALVSPTAVVDATSAYSTAFDSISGVMIAPTATHPATGLFTVTFGGLGASWAGSNGGNVQVAAVGANPDRCQVVGWSPISTRAPSGYTTASITTTIACNDVTGARADSGFSVFFQRGYGAPTAGTTAGSAYAWIDVATATIPEGASATAPAGYQWSSLGAVSSSIGSQIVVRHQNVGVYDVKVPGLVNMWNGVARATGYGTTSGYCTAGYAEPSGDGSYQDVYVFCFNTHGLPLDAAFSFRWDEDSLPTALAGGRGAYNVSDFLAPLSAPQSTSFWSYDAQAPSPVNGSVSESYHPTTGLYFEAFGGYDTTHTMPLVGGNVAWVSDGGYCKAVGDFVSGSRPSATLFVKVNCYGATGILHDTSTATLVLSMP